jgi:hypothetical protein
MAPAVAVAIVSVVPELVAVPANPGKVTACPTPKAPEDTADTFSAVPEHVAVPAPVAVNVLLTFSPAALAVKAPAVAETVPLKAVYTAAGASDGNAVEAHTEPVDINTLPIVPGLVNPVPPSTAGKGVVVRSIAGVVMPVVPFNVIAIMRSPCKS